VGRRAGGRDRSRGDRVGGRAGEAGTTFLVGIASDADELEELWGDVPAVEIEAAATA